MDQKFLKITYHSPNKKINAYLNKAAPFFHVLMANVCDCLFVEHQQPRCEIRTFWIDEDGDEIEIVNQSDYDIFLIKRSKHQHLQVAPVNATTTNDTPKPQETSSKAAPQTQTPTADDTNDGRRIHANVECDSCLMAPIVGFRYKCIQCPNYDLCQNCEAKHVHGDHMMVRMPNNECPYVVDAWVSGGGCGRGKFGRKHEKRCKSGGEATRQPYGFTFATTSSNTDAEKSKDGSAETSAERHHHGRKHHRRHARHNILSHLYEMMHDLAEGGGAAAAAAAMGPTRNGEATNDSTATGGAGATGENEAEIVAKAAAAAAHAAAESAQEIAAKASEIAVKVAQQTAAANAKPMQENVASTTEQTKAAEPATAEKVHPHISTHIPLSSASPTQPPFTPHFPPLSLECLAKFLDPQCIKTGIDIVNNFTDNFAKMSEPMQDKESRGDYPSTSSCPFTKNDRPSTAATNVPLTQPQQPQTVPVLPSPSLESLAQFLDPQYMKTGIQILNNFSDMFAKMLDPMDGAEGGDSSPSSSFCPFDPNARKNSFASTQSNNSQKSNNSSKSTDLLLPNESKQNENSVTKEAEAVQSAANAKKQDSTSSLVEISDLGSDSETDSVSESFIKLTAPTKVNTPEKAIDAATATTSQDTTTTPPSLNKSNVMDFAQLSADLKAHIAQEEQRSANSPAKVAQENNTTRSDAVPDELRAVPVFNNTNTTNATNVQTNKPEEQRPVPIYHSDERINSAVHSMMSMGFSNEGAWLTQLLDSVNGNISEALDLISATQREAR